MRRRELIIVLISSVFVGLGVYLVLNGFPFDSSQRAFATVGRSAGIPESTVGTTVASLFSITPVTTNVVRLTPVPTLTPVKVGDPTGPDLEDILLLYSSDHPSNFDTNFCKIAEFYGLLCKRIDLEGTELTDSILHDALGAYFRLIGIRAYTLQEIPGLLTEDEIAVLEAAIESGSSNLLVSNINDQTLGLTMAELTGNALQEVTLPKDSQRDWIVSMAAPEITQQFTGQIITSTTSAPQRDFALIYASNTLAIPLISSMDDAGGDYQIFTWLPRGAGSVFLDAGEQGPSLDGIQLKDLYFSPAHFSHILPLMFTVRYTAGNEAWHNDHCYANLALDDPTLIEPFLQLSYSGLLMEMQFHNFHTTIAFIPANWEKWNPEVASLFMNFPERYSLVQHGNNHDGYEFYKYSTLQDDVIPAVPLSEQEWNIREGMARMEMLQKFPGIPYDQIMVFPQGIAPEQTLVLLKKYNYLATVNAQDIPLDSHRSEKWDDGMYPANLNYGNFPLLTRSRPGSYSPFRPNIQPFIFDLFINKPALMYSLVNGKELFTENIKEFDTVADQLNQLCGSISWLSLGNIVRHLYLEKANDDGSIDVMMFARELILSNETNQTRTYHVLREETLNVPIRQFTVNGNEFPYHVVDGLLTVDVEIHSNSSVEISIQYDDE